MYELKKDILNKLRSLPYAKYDGHTQLMIRCPYCGDSIKDITHTHFGVKIDFNSNKLMVFQCFRCGISGILTSEVLRMIDSCDLEMASALTKFNKSNGVVNTGFYHAKNTYNMIIPDVVENEKNILKKKYIEDRLGISLTFEELQEKKVVFSVLNFMKENNITSTRTSIDNLKILQEKYIGFLSARNEFINFRACDPKIKQRWYNLNIFNKYDTTGKFYIMPTDIDISTHNTITLNIAEGIFDIFGLYYNIYNRCEEDMIYCAVCGAGFESVIKYILRLGFVGDIIVNIYSDSDRKPYYYKPLKTSILPWVKSINLFYNNIGKDYGVRYDEIELIQKRL